MQVRYEGPVILNAPETHLRAAHELANHTAEGCMMYDAV